MWFYVFWSLTPEVRKIFTNDSESDRESRKTRSRPNFLPKSCHQSHVQREKRPMKRERRLDKRKSRKIGIQVGDLDTKFCFVKFLAAQNVHFYPYIRVKHRFRWHKLWWWRVFGRIFEYFLWYSWLCRKYRKS